MVTGGGARNVSAVDGSRAYGYVPLSCQGTPLDLPGDKIVTNVTLCHGLKIHSNINSQQMGWIVMLLLLLLGSALSAPTLPLNQILPPR